jgi:hypothetical protein
MIADQFNDTQLWDLLWSRIIQSLKPEDQFQQFGQEDDQIPMSLHDPDWNLLSPKGYTFLLQLASRMLTMSPQNCIALIVKEDNIMFDALSYMLSDRFLNALKKT